MTERATTVLGSTGLALAWLSAGVAVLAFFLPWARLDMREPELMRKVRQTAEEQSVLQGLATRVGKVTAQIRRGTETITGDLPSLSDVPRAVSGVQVPQLANQKNAQVAMAVLELLTNTRQHVGAKSYAVYLVPGLLLAGALLLTALRGRAAALVITALGAAVAGVGFWKLLTTDTDALFIAITIAPGLWLSLWAYVGLAVGALLRGIAPSARA